MWNQAYGRQTEKLYADFQRKVSAPTHPTPRHLLCSRVNCNHNYNDRLTSEVLGFRASTCLLENTVQPGTGSLTISAWGTSLLLSPGRLFRHSKPGIPHPWPHRTEMSPKQNMWPVN